MTVTGTGESWLYGTAMEHSFLWQYNFSGCGAVTTIVTQTESDYWSVPPSGWAMVHENVRVQMYGSGWYNWFNGNQTALWTAHNSTGNAFLVNVHGTNNVVVGDVTIPAYTPIEEECACCVCVCMMLLLLEVPLTLPYLHLFPARARFFYSSSSLLPFSPRRRVL